VSYSAGATNDIVARAVAQRLSVAFKQNFFVENRVGGNGTIGSGFVAKEPADGYNLLLGNTSILGIHPSLFASLPYDPVKDFQAVSILAESPTVLVVNAAMPVLTVKELVAFSKANPKSVAYGSPGTGTPFHLSGELFNSQTGTSMLHVPYKGAAPAVVDLLGGHTNCVVLISTQGISYIREGRLNALAATSEQRLAILPNVPTLQELGLKGFLAGSWNGLFAPAGTPVETTELIAKEIQRALKDPKIIEQYDQIGITIIGNDPQGQAKFLASDIARWRDVIQNAKIPQQ
jgi:tripartite-type tricarboxylate transporter receptor subunit TctC